MIRARLDAGDHTALVIDVDRRRAELAHDAGDRRSPLVLALERHLRVRVDGGARSPLDEAGALSWPPGGALLELSLAGAPLLEVDLRTGAILQASPLSPIEQRFLAENGVPHPGGASAEAGPAPRTDLHTHFAACVCGAALVRMAAAAEVTMPRAILAELGIHAAEEDVPLASLPEPLLALAGRRLAVPHDRQITFLEMERLYRLRAPLTKHPRLLVPQLSRIAEDYARAGVTYVELSLSDVVRGEVLRAIHREVPAIEARTGVTLRFLAAISRHDDLEWDLDVIDRLEEIAPSPYVVGLDVMGHETTSTRSFARQLTTCAERMGARRPGWVIRVHAGESPAFPGNVREALELARGHDVRLRIGHGLYGVDEATLDALVREGVIVEFNLTSNFSLNNVQSLADVPLVRYARAGARVVLGSDGPGLYETDARMEARAARLAGLDEDDLAGIRETEARYVEERLALDARSTRPEWEPSGDLVSRHFGPAVIARRRERREARDARLHRALSDRGITLLGDAELEAFVAGRRVVSIAGSWKNTWSATPPEERAAITRELEALVRGLDGAVLITGGTRFGVEREAQRAARAAGVDVVAAIVSESPPDDLCADVRWATLVAEDLYAKAAGLYQLVRRVRGACVFVGGGPIVSDEIQIAHNLRLPILLMDGPPGASTRHARERPDAAFRAAGEALGRLAARGPRPAPFWYLGPNPTADVVLLRDDGEAPRFLAIRRDLDAPCEAGRWALPGGFVRTDAARGEPWRAGVEPALEAALRELREEAGLDLTAHAASFQTVGTYEGGGRDPRDEPAAWSRSTAFALLLPEALHAAPIAGGDDASDACWMELARARELAFDHARIVQDAVALLAR